MFILISNEPIKVADLPKLVNQLMLNNALVREMLNNPFSESKKNFGRLMKRERSTDFIKYLHFSEVQKNVKVINI